MPCVWSSLSGLPPALHYIINIHLLISVLLVIFFFFYFIAFKLPFPSLFMISWPIFLANKKIRRKVKEQLVNVWIWIKKTKSHNQHSDIVLDDLSLEFFLEISSAICNTLCHTFFFFFGFISSPCLIESYLEGSFSLHCEAWSSGIIPSEKCPHLLTNPRRVSW